MPRLLANLALSAAGLIVFGLFCELVVFRFILPASDIPANAFEEGVVKYAPEQAGVYRVRDEIAAPFRINRQGWNSAHAAYSLARTPDRKRIAMVGDSYVEALQVPFDQSLAERLEQELAPEVEVYRFAISGAPLSQYLHMFREEVARYAPDLAIFVLAHNDFDESFEFKEGRYTSSFLKLRLSEGEVAEEIPPEPYRRTWVDLIRSTATVRYLYYRWQLNLPNVRRGLLSLISPEARAADGAQYQANIEVDRLAAKLADIEAATGYLLCRILDAAVEQGTAVLLVIDGVRTAVYAGQDQQAAYREGALRLNALASTLARERDIPFLDLHPLFASDYARHGKRIEHRADHHWNGYGHHMVAASIGRYVTKEGLLQRSVPGSASVAPACQ